MSIGKNGFRTLSENAYSKINEDPYLGEIIKDAIENKDYSLEIRDEYICIYYKGGKALEIEFKEKVPNKIDFDKKYLVVNKQKTNLALSRWLEKKSRVTKDWAEKRSEIKEAMDIWFSEHPKEERNIQQELISCNTFKNNGNYQIVDIEFDTPRSIYGKDNKRPGRFDMIAVKKEKQVLVPVIVELKNGYTAFDGKSGVLDHYNKMSRYLKDENCSNFLVKNIESIIAAKKRLGVLEHFDLDKPILPDRFELIFGITNWQKSPSEKLRKKVCSVFDKVKEEYAKEKSSLFTVLIATGEGRVVNLDDAVPLEEFAV